MSQEERDRKARMREGSGSPPPPLLQLLILFGVVVLLVLSALQWREARKARAEAASEIAGLESTLGKLSTKLDEMARKAAAPVAQQQRPQAPDPNKVYSVQTAGAPSQGPANAPITIAEFSDFQ